MKGVNDVQFELGFIACLRGMHDVYFIVLL